VAAIERQPAQRMSALPEVAERLPLHEIEQKLIRERLTG
jgi:hypothetical protein